MSKYKFTVIFTLIAILLLHSGVLAQSTNENSPEMIRKDLVDSVNSFTDQTLKTGWLQYKFIVQMSENSGELPNGTKLPSATVEEKWYYYDGSIGTITKIYEWSTTEGGVQIQEGLLDKNYWINITLETMSPEPVILDPGMDFTFGFIDRFDLAIANGGKVVQEKILDGNQEIWKFSYTYPITELTLQSESGTPITKAHGHKGVIYLETNTGKILGQEDYLVNSDGSQKLTQKVTTLELSTENQPPIERFARIKSNAEALSAKLPHSESLMSGEVISLFSLNQSNWYQTSVIGGVNVTAQKDLYYRMSHNQWGGSVNTRSTNWVTPLYNVGMHWYSVQEWCNSTRTYSKYSENPMYNTNSLNYSAGAYDLTIRAGCSTHQIRSNGAHYVRHNGYDWVPYPDTSIYQNRP